MFPSVCILSRASNSPHLNDTFKRLASHSTLIALIPKRVSVKHFSKMAPNLFLLAKKAVSPWKWCSFQTKPTSNSHRLYFGKEPVAGIYALTSKRYHYLVAIKPKRKPDVHGIFRTTRNNSMCDKSELAKNNVISTTREVSAMSTPQLT